MGVKKREYESRFLIDIVSCNAGIATCGAGADIEEARRPAIVEKNGVKVAFLGYSSILFPGFAATAKGPGCAPLKVHTFYRMSEEEQRLFRLLDGLSPGEFRRLAKIGHWHRGEGATVLTEEQKPLDRLYYVLDGAITIDKAGHRFEIPPETFIGEVAFLTGRPASATVTVRDSAHYVAWDKAALRRLQMRAPSLSIALHAALNKDMAIKVAKA